jgi:AraC-like DNA-binding protein
MVCDRCKLVVRQELERQGLHPEGISLGEVTLKENNLTDQQLINVDAALAAVGFERIDDRKARLNEAIKSKVIRMIHYDENTDRRFSWSKLLSGELHYEYSYLSNLFSSIEGITLEQYIIRQKIERVKELITYDELSLKEIASRLNYSSISHLSSQFKKVTGLTPSYFKNIRHQQRKSLDKV